MKICLLQIELRLDGCRSLKEKRSRLAPLKTLGGKAGIAMAEVGLQDSLRDSQWAFVLVGNDAAQVDRLGNQVEAWVAERIDAWVVDITREVL